MWERLKKAFKKYEDYRASNGYTCDCCGREVFSYPSPRLCKACLEALPKGAYYCPKCGRKTKTEGVCLECKGQMPTFRFAFSAYPYEGIIRPMINRMKNGSAYLARFFAEALAVKIEEKREEEGLDAEECVFTCVPDRKKERLKERGRRYNPAEELARRTCELLGAECDAEVMVKSRETRPQKRMSAKERFENVRGAYRVHKRKVCEGKTVVVFDDILTTGATGDECARILLAAGAKRVIFVTAVTVPERVEFPAFAD